MKKIIFTVLICFGMIASNAQRIGIKGGLNFAKGKYENGTPNETLLGIQLGVVGDYFFTENIYGNSGLLYSVKGQKYSIGGTSYKYPIHYLEIPVNAGYRVDLGNSLAFFAQAGPYIGIGITAKDKDFGSDNELKRIDFGLNVGTGVEYDKFQFGINYGLGIVDIDNSPGKFKNRVLSLTVVYYLPF